jgi:accessory gene regulator B
VIAYGLEVVFSNLVTLLLILVGSMIFGILKEVVIAAFTWFIIRQSAGGAHCSTLWRCAFLSSFILVVTGLAAVIIAIILGQDIIIIFTACTSLVLVPTYIWAPAPNPNKPINSEARRKKLRHLALLLQMALILFFLIVVLITPLFSLTIAGCLSMITAVLMLTPAGYRVIAAVDRLCCLLFATIKRKEV